MAPRGKPPVRRCRYRGFGRIAALVMAMALLTGPARAPAVQDDLMENLGVFQPPWFAEFLDVELYGGFAYIFGVSGLSKLAIADPEDLTLSARYEPPGSPWVRYYRGAIIDDIAFAGGREDLLHVVDIRLNWDTYLAAVHGEPGYSYEGMVHRDGYLYAARHGEGLEIIDVSVPGLPISVAEFPELTNAWDAAFAGNHLLVVDGVGGLAVFDVTDPTAAVHLLSLPLSGAAMDIAVSGDIAVAACGGAGIDVIDVSDPTAPVVLASANTSGLAVGVAIFGDHAVVADWDDVEIFDIGDPSAPVYVGGENTPVRAMGVAAAGDLVYVADWAQVRAYRFGPTTKGDIEVSIQGMVFGGVPLGTTADTTFTIANTGGSPVTVLDIQEFGENFAILPPTTFTLLPGASQDVTMTYTPVVEDFDATFLRIDSDDDDEDVTLLPVTGGHDPQWLDVGEMAPNFRRADTEGVVQRLIDYRGRVVVLAFFANW